MYNIPVEREERSRSRTFQWLAGAALSVTLAVGAQAQSTDWAMHGSDYSNTRYSALTQINANNVSKLQSAWSQSLGVLDGQEASPIVVNGTMYVATSHGPKYVYAFDAKSGALKWTREFTVPEDVARFACCIVGSRGVSYSDGKIFAGRLDGKLTALDANTGKELWTTTVVDYKQGSVITSPPLVVGDKIITGFGGGEYGAVGYLSAYDANTGKQLWKTLSVPESVSSTWKGDTWKTGGAAFWFCGSYDPQTKTVFWGTSNPSPWNAAVRGADSPNYGDMTNLYSASTLAIDPETGAIKAHYQTTPYDAWDYDGVNELVLADLNLNGKKTPVAMKADRNGFFYVIDRTSMKPISAEKFVKTNWAEKIDLKTGRPVEAPQYRLTSKGNVKDVWPSFIGGKNWQQMSYSPKTGLVYIPANQIGMDFNGGDVAYQRGYFYLGAEWSMTYDSDKTPGEYIAWDPVKQKKVWSIPQKYPIPGGALTTAGDLLFFGNMEGKFNAVDAKTGKMLWSYNAGSGVGAAPITYSIDGRQYLAVVSGRPTIIPGFIGGKMGEDIVKATPAGAALHVFALPESNPTALNAGK